MAKFSTCYVCGEICHDSKSFVEHIVSVHEEGREYIKCPLHRCKAPVRDLRSHFKTAHPYDKIPAGIQTRATVWYDIRNPSKRHKLPSFQKGSIVSIKNHGKEMTYRSSWEKNVYESLEVINEVVSYAVEPISIEYYYNGRPKRYYPDLKIVLCDGTVEIWEIKPHNQKGLEMNQAKWAAAKTYCHCRGWTFKVIDETEIKKLKNKLL